MSSRGWVVRVCGLLQVLCLTGPIGGCGYGPDTTQTIDELGYGPAGRVAILRQAVDTNDQSYLYTRQGQLLPIRLAERTQAGLAEQWGSLEYEPLAYLCRRALKTSTEELFKPGADPFADPVAASATVQPDRIFNTHELDRGRKVLRTTGVIGSLGFLKADDVRVDGGIAVSRQFGLDLHRYFVIYGIIVQLNGEIMAFYMPVPLADKQFTKVYDDLMEKQHSFTILDFAGWYYKHQAFVSENPASADHYWVLPTLVGPVPTYTPGYRYAIGPQEEEHFKWVAERPLVPKGGEQVLHRGVYEFVSGKAQGMLRHNGQLLLTSDQVFNALAADSLEATPGGKAPQLQNLSVVVTVDQGDDGAAPNLGQLKDTLDLIAAQKVGWIFVKVLNVPGPAPIDLEALRQQWLEEKAARDAARKNAPAGPANP